MLLLEVFHVTGRQVDGVCLPNELMRKKAWQLLQNGGKFALPASSNCATRLWVILGIQWVYWVLGKQTTDRPPSNTSHGHMVTCFVVLPIGHSTLPCWWVGSQAGPCKSSCRYLRTSKVLPPGQGIQISQQPHLAVKWIRTQSCGILSTQ